MKDLTALGCTAVLIGGVAVLALSLTRPCPTGPVEFRRADGEEDARAAGGAFPAAVAYGADGSAVSDAAHGLAAIRDLLRHSTARSRRPGSEVTR